MSQASYLLASETQNRVKNGFCGTRVRTEALGRPDGPSFSCQKSNYGIFCRAVQMGKSFRLDEYNGRPDIQFT
jgi:hypothetical protein